MPRSTNSTNCGHAALVTWTCGAAANASSYALLLIVARVPITPMCPLRVAATARRTAGPDHLDHRDGVALPGVVQARRGGAVARDDEQLDAFADQVVEAVEGVPAHVGDRLRPVRHVRRVADVDHLLVRAIGRGWPAPP